jgi:short-subunit dehydrogenase
MNTFVEVASEAQASADMVSNGDSTEHSWRGPTSADGSCPPTVGESRSRRHVVITGASSGIGAALAKLYSEAGGDLSLLARDPRRLAEVAGDCRAAGSEVDVCAGDVTDADGMERWLAACDARRPVDVIIANAGLGGSFAIAGDTAEPGAVARQIIQTNTLGVVNTIAPLLPAFLKRKRGHVVIVTSMAGSLGLPDCPAYSASKAATRVYADGLRRLLVRHGIRITVVCPGFIDTPMSASLTIRRPFLWSLEDAARHIFDGITRGRREIVFPWQLRLAMGAASLLPTFAVDKLVHWLRPEV